MADSLYTRIMTYNIRQANTQDGANNWDNRKEKVVALLLKYDPDIRCVQEAFHHQLLEHKTTWLSETPEQAGSKGWDAALPRIVTWTRFRDRITGITFQVFNTHHDDTGTEARKRSSDLLLRRIRESRKNDGEELILAGDFNVLQNEEAYTILTAPDSPVRDTRPASESGGTFCGFDVSNGPLPAIDYIFITDGWTEPDYQIIRDNDGTYNLSDHFPVLVSMRHRSNGTA